MTTITPVTSDMSNSEIFQEYYHRHSNNLGFLSDDEAVIIYERIHELGRQDTEISMLILLHERMNAEISRKGRCPVCLKVKDPTCITGC